MLKRIINYAATLLAILLCLACGKAINHLFGGLPGSLYGLLLFAIFLNSRVLDANTSGEIVGKLIYFMPIVFLPVCVGVMEYYDLLREIGFRVLLVGVLTTTLGIVVAAWVAQRVLAAPNSKKEPSCD